MDDGSLRSVTAGSTAPPLLAVEHCPGCRGTSTEPVLRAHGGIALVRCTDCELVHATAGYAPRFLDEHYADRADRAPTSSSGTTTPRSQSQRKRQALALYDRLSEGRLSSPAAGTLALDIGCGIGLLLDLLRERGYTTVGIERSGAAARAMDAGHRIHAIDIEGEVSLDERFDVITLTHLLEHLRRPEDALRWVGRHLHPGGLAIIEVPNWDDLARPLWGPSYRPLELGDHVSFFQRHTLAALCERAGLRLHTLWSAPQARTLVFPSLLTGLDHGKGMLRRLRGRRSSPAGDGVGVAGERTVTGPARWRHAAVTAALTGLDRLDPLLESLTGRAWTHGANLVAVVEAGT